jgi:hypothetical protein
MPRRSGPASARNFGVRHSRGGIVLFIDADVVVRPDTIARVAAQFETNPGLAAVFGSYDDDPSAKNFLSQYKNLFHHYVHQTGEGEIRTFWSGCGAIRRSSFLALGGFDPTYTRPSIEDIELGYRLRAAGAPIRLAKHIQVTHLKRWTFWDIVRTDLRDRALPWTALIARTRCLPDDLNLDWASRASALSVYAPRPTGGRLARCSPAGLQPTSVRVFSAGARALVLAQSAAGPLAVLRLLGACVRWRPADGLPPVPAPVACPAAAPRYTFSTPR